MPNSLILYSAIMATFSLVEVFYPVVGNPGLDFGIAMILLGFGLVKENGRKV